MTWLSRLLLLALPLLAAFYLIEPLYEAAHLLERHYNEGWNAYSQLQFTLHRSIYPPLEAMHTNNYPPLSYAIIGGIARFGGDQVLIGRAVALISLVAVTLMIGLLVWRLGRSFMAAFAVMAWFLAYHAAYAADFVALNDPQWLAHAVMTLVLLLLALGQRSVLAVILAAVLAVTAGMIKHAIVSLPIAVLLWLLVTDFRKFLLWSVAGAAALAIAILLGELVFPGFVGGILSTEQVRNPNTALEYWGFLWVMGAPVLPALLLTILVGLHRWREPAIRLVLIYAIVSAVVGVALLRGGGTTLNMLFDLSIAATIGAGICLGRLFSGEPTRFNRIGRVAALLLLALAVAKALPNRLLRFPEWVQTMPVRLAETASDIALIRAQERPVLCEALIMCFWAGKPIGIDFFNYGLRLKAGVVDPETMIAGIREQRYALIQLELPRYLQPRLTQNVSDAIDHYYRVERSRPHVGEILVPR